MSQAQHRNRLISGWAVIKPGSRILELGCGQGECTSVLAEAVGPSGTIDAVDPASLDYGAPTTLGEAQAELSYSPLGDRITWHQASPEQFLDQTSKKGETWDVVVLSHCLWYFKSPDTLEAILRALRNRTDAVCIAEYALHATHPAACAHVLAALARASLESYKAESDENIQNILTPTGIKETCTNAGWKLEHETVLVPEAELQDGFWETNTVASAGFLKEIDYHVQDKRAKAYLRAARDAVLSSVATNGSIKATQTMDVWSAVFSPAAK
ncbi:S-adenosyl-L-methionine-dependent methyltransferase [Dactylonectria estremocensis]|uniref:S-adenosyl-L-methionine-dependent methyltransferase n=1 Tax=Dactylonectria estremocensis TaxID=1079267 RepID=A0A9P9JAH5_9HYPO|nr:S-adenosyl-L-methionine-dependent methyltransferase [Dactylonectria estremocensis]